MKGEHESMWQKYVLFIRLGLLVLFLLLVAGFAASEYYDVRGLVLTPCINCIGLGG